MLARPFCRHSIVRGRTHRFSSFPRHFVANKPAVDIDRVGGGDGEGQLVTMRPRGEVRYIYKEYSAHSPRSARVCRYIEFQKRHGPDHIVLNNAPPLMLHLTDFASFSSGPSYKDTLP